MISGGIIHVCAQHGKRLLYGDNDKCRLIRSVYTYMYNTYVCFESFLKEETTSGFNSNFVLFYFFLFLS